MKKIKIIFHISENLYYRYGGVNKFLNILNNNLKSYRHNFIDVEKIKILKF